MTEDELTTLRGDVDGWRGRFIYGDKHRCGVHSDASGYDAALVFERNGDVDSCEDWYMVGDRLDADVGESLARMLNATRPLLAQVARLSQQHEAMALGCETMTAAHDRALARERELKERVAQLEDERETVQRLIEIAETITIEGVGADYTPKMVAASDLEAVLAGRMR